MPGLLQAVAIVLVWCCDLARAQEAQTLTGPNPALTPGDFLDHVGKQAKARWRQFYRETPPATPSDRLRVAFMCGALLGDSYLAQKAGDSQQFKNTNQDLISYCRVLGMAEKVTPGFLAAAKASERDDWSAVRQLVSETQALIESLLNEQRDEDLAALVVLGLWMRLFEISTAIVSNDEEIADKTLCIGSVPLLNSFKARYDLLGESTRESDTIAKLGSVLEVLQRHWANSDGRPSADLLGMTSEKLAFLMNRLTQK